LFSWTDEAEQVIQAAVGDDLPVAYVCDAATVAAEYDRPGLAGYTSSFLDVLLERSLRAQSRWRGRGHASVIFRNRIKTDAFALGVAAHEAAHHLDVLAELGQPADAIGLPDGDLRALIAEPIPTGCAAVAEHGLEFTRAALHLAFRIQRLPGLGWFGPEFMCIAGSRYGLSSCFAYVDALGDERQERASEPITAILASQPPAAFAAVWESDAATLEGKA